MGHYEQKELALELFPKLKINDQNSDFSPHVPLLQNLR